MAKTERFEDLKCWQQARVLVKEIYIISEQGRLSKDFDTRSQIRRAALSSMNNIAAGFGKFSRKEFVRYLDIAGNSASEVKSILYVLLDLNYLPEHEVTVLQNKAEEVKALCLGMIKYIVNRSKQNT